MGTLSRETTLPFHHYRLSQRGITLKGMMLLLQEKLILFESSPPLEELPPPGKQTDSHKVVPFCKMAENIEVYSYTSRPCYMCYGSHKGHKTQHDYFFLLRFESVTR